MGWDVKSKICGYCGRKFTDFRKEGFGESVLKENGFLTGHVIGLVKSSDTVYCSAECARLAKEKADVAEEKRKEEKAEQNANAQNKLDSIRDMSFDSVEEAKRNINNLLYDFSIFSIPETIFSFFSSKKSWGDEYGDNKENVQSQIKRILEKGMREIKEKHGSLYDEVMAEYNSILEKRKKAIKMNCIIWGVIAAVIIVPIVIYDIIQKFMK